MIRAPLGFVWPLRAVALTGLPIDEVLTRAVEIEGTKFVPQRWAEDYGSTRTQRERDGVRPTTPAPRSLSLVSRAEKREVFLEPSPIIFCDGEPCTRVAS